MSLRRFALVLIGALTIVVAIAHTPASASLNQYRLNGGVANRHFWVDPSMINPVYGTLSRQAVTSWNSIGTRVSFTEVPTACCDSQQDFYARDYGNIGWDGVAVSRLNNGSAVQACTTCAPFANWDYTELSLNDYYLKTYPYTTDSQGVAAHEFGHGIALDHSTYTCALMRADTATRRACGTWVPQQNDDISLASQLQ